MIHRFKAAVLAFKNPGTYWEGVAVKELAARITLRDEIAILRPDSKTGYVVESPSYRDQKIIRAHLGR